MKRALAVLVVVAASFAGRRAAADAPSPPPLPTGIHVLDEPADAWLHDHCSYRGIVEYSTKLLAQPGTIAKLASTRGAARDVKVFRCVEAPPFVSYAFKPAPIESVTCTEARPAPSLCVPPISLPKAAPRANAAVSVRDAGATVTWSPAIIRVRAAR
ncbi:MAG: hypothetical protein KF819_23750 [Labilithrix sp.]|nr:hypothetical protein [Labilithrix sp.]